MKEKQNLGESKTILFIIGIVIGIALSSFAPEQLLHALIYRDILSIVEASLIIGIAILTLVIFGEKHPFGLTRKQAYRMFSIGVSLASFVLAGCTFLNYPAILKSNNYNWVIPGSNWVGIGTVNIGSLAFFNYSVLWDTAVGSFFGVFVNWFRLA